MMTASSIPATSAAGYADYLESRTVAPERGDYYLGTDGAPAESPGRWLTSEASLRSLGIDAGWQAAPDDLRALMEGRSPASSVDSPVWLRPAGADGSRAGGLDVTFSAPKSVSVVWGVSDPAMRQVIEGAHHDAVAAAVGHLRDHVAMAGGRIDGRATPIPARELHAAEFLHTTARGAQGSVPDPQLHSHVVITSVERPDGSFAAVRSRPVFQAARELGAVYRAQLASGLRDAGFAIDAAGDQDRYFRIRGVSESVERVFSKRTTEVRQAAEDFRARHGRDPERGELRDLAVRTREAKLLNTRAELDHSWRSVAGEHGLDLSELFMHDGQARDVEAWSVRVEEQVTARQAVFDERELRSVAYEQAPGAGLGPDDVLVGLQRLRDEGRLVDLENGSMTTARMRELETVLERQLVDLGGAERAPIGSRFRDHAVAQVEERIGHELTGEQLDAVHVLTGEQRVAVLIGQAGTGKGVVIDVAARAEQAAGREVHGVAVAGRTAQQLGEASPALSGRVRTLDGFVSAAERGQVRVDARTSVFVDEAGMGDTERLARLTDLVGERGASLVLIGDGRQLPSVGAGGMFERVQERVPHAELTAVMRTPDPTDQAAWRALRDGDPAAAMAHYRQRGDLRFAESRAEAVDAAARRSWSSRPSTAMLRSR
jgi:conjugative relaxase-like TrwC/TraI family protein